MTQKYYYDSRDHSSDACGPGERCYYSLVAHGLGTLSNLEPGEGSVRPIQQMLGMSAFDAPRWSAAAPRLPTLLVRAVRRHARVTDACESAAPGSPLRILLEARIRACPGMDTTTFGASRHISFEHGALELIWTQNDTCRYVSSGYRALDHDHSHGIPSLQRLSRVAIACMFPAGGRNTASKSTALPYGPCKRARV
jgi:hypothetical protein